MNPFAPLTGLDNYPRKVAALGIVTDGLLAEYRLDEGSGGTANDSSGNGNHATLGLGGDFLPAWNSRGLAFPSLSLLIPPAALYQSAVTKQFFCQSVPTDPAYQGLIGNGAGGFGVSFNSGSAQVLLGTSAAPQIQSLREVSGNVSLSMLGGAPGKCYVNGIEASYLIQGNGAWGSATGTNHWIGYTLGNAFEREIWYILYYSRELTSEEVLQNHNAVSAILAGRSVTLSGGFTVPRVAFCGDSRTVSYHSTTGERYPTVAMNGLSANWVNLGIGGANSGYNASLVTTALAGASGKVVVLWLGTNDLAVTGQVANVQANLASRVATFQADGAQVIICTEIDRNTNFSGGQNQAGYRADVVTLNSWINAGLSGADFVADIGSESELQDADNATYFADQVHLTTAGAAIVAALVNEKLDAAGVT